MANITAIPEWRDVRVLERDEVALGGVDGNMNEQATSLVARTEFLMEEKASVAQVNAVAVGNKAYRTYTDMDADKANIEVNSKVTVTNDTLSENNGDWQWDGSTFTKSTYDPLTQAKDYVDSNGLFNPIRITSGMFTNVDNIKTSGFYICESNTVASEISGLPTDGRAFVLSVINKNSITRQELSHLGESFTYVRTTSVNGTFPVFGRLTTKNESESYTNDSLQVFKDSFIYEASLNMFNPANAVTGYRLNGVGRVSPVAGAKHTGMIPVSAGVKYTISWSNAVTEAPYFSFFANRTDIAPISYSTSVASSPLTVTAPLGANFIVVNLKHTDTSVERSNFQIEVGSVATAYQAWSSLGFKIKDSYISDSFLKVEDFVKMQNENPKDYEIVTVSRNLFDESQIQDGKFLSTVNGGISSGAGWKISGFIPVVAGQTYTLSGSRVRQGVSFFSTNTPSTNPALSYNNTTTLPLTLTAPVGATYAVIALESATVKGWNNIQFEQGSEVTQYIPYGGALTQVDSAYVVGGVIPPTTSKKAELNLVNGTGTIKSGDLQLGVKIFNPVTYTGSAVFNFNNDQVGGTTVRVNGDDSAPVRMMGATVGANHGYSRSNLTLTTHGKTNADVGSVWTDGTNQWVIIQINSADVIGVTCRTANIGYNSSLPTLTHVSGATNTTTFTPTARSLAQWYPMLKNHRVRLSLDNEVVEDVNFTGGFDNSMKVSESYDLMEKSDIVEWLISNGGQQVTTYNAPSACNVSNTHNFSNKLTDVISANFFVYKDLSAAQDLMFTQSARLNIVNSEVLYYVPRSIPFVHESVNYNFSKPFNVVGLTITNRIDFTTTRTETNVAVPDRLIMLAGDVGYATGYLPILGASADVRNSLTSKGIQISKFDSKVYPYLVDGLTTLTAGANYSCVAYRTYFTRPVETRRISQYEIPFEDNVYLFLDWQQGDFVDVIELRSELQGRTFEVIEKTLNVDILSNVTSENIAVKINTVENNARLILKF